jgi:hypothetical protein
MFFFCYRKMYFWYISHVYMNTHVPYLRNEMHCFASVFMCFHCVFTAETCTIEIFHNYTRIHMYHSLYMKWTVLLVFFMCFHCVLTAETCTFGIFLSYTRHMFHTLYMKCTGLQVFSCVFIVFLL